MKVGTRLRHLGQIGFSQTQPPLCATCAMSALDGGSETSDPRAMSCLACLILGELGLLATASTSDSRRRAAAVELRPRADARKRAGTALLNRAGQRERPCPYFAWQTRLPGGSTHNPSGRISGPDLGPPRPAGGRGKPLSGSGGRRGSFRGGLPTEYNGGHSEQDQSAPKKGRQGGMLSSDPDRQSGT
jgi:hypothetical protein